MIAAASASAGSGSGRASARAAVNITPGSVAGTADARCACVRAASDASVVKPHSRASARSAMAAISPGDMRALTPHDHAPTRLQASSSAMWAAQFSATSSTRSVGRTPAASRSFAAVSTMACSAP
ncbi:hypothetical protein D9M69_507570 [compost metagenome]